MKKIRRVVTAAMISLSLASVAQACSYEDEWTGKDKAAHFGVSMGLGVATSRLTDDTTTAFGLALVPGFAKELMDSQRNCNRFSWKDMAWNAAGAYVGVRTGNWILGPTGVNYIRAF